MGLVIHVDGGARGNPGPAGAGVVIHDAYEPVFEAGFFLGSQTNNAAEYLALIRALRHAQSIGAQPLTIRSDSELIVRQVTGQYRVKSPALQALHEQVQMLLLRVPRWTIEHVRREHNARADELANMAMDARSDVVVTDTHAVSGDQAEPGGAASGGAENAPAQGADPARIILANRARSVQVVAERPPSAEACPAGAWNCKSFVVEATMPAGVCVHAAHAVLPTVLAVQGTSADEVGAIPTMTVRCTHAECGAVFHVCAKVIGNGQP